MSREQVIDWASPISHILLNPKLPAEQTKGLELRNLPRLPFHIWVASSGSTGGLKIYALSKTAFLLSAEAVNTHLKVKKSDIWLNVLPLFHVGGLGILARAHLSKSRIFDRSLDAWSAEKFHVWAEESRATLTSLVPTQLYDLVKMGKPAPLSLRAIVIGGAALPFEQYQLARAMGFRILPSYGMTECCSQIATASLESVQNDDELYDIEKIEMPPLKKLSHVELRLEDDQLAVNSSALFTAQAYWRGTHAEVLWRSGKWYVTPDRANLDVTKVMDKKSDIARTQVLVTPLGRGSDQIKISGELVSLPTLREQWLNLTAKNVPVVEWHLTSRPHQRTGHEIVLVITQKHFARVGEWISEFNSQVLPVARVRAVYFVSEIPRSDLGKPQEERLKTVLKF